MSRLARIGRRLAAHARTAIDRTAVGLAEWARAAGAYADRWPAPPTESPAADSAPDNPLRAWAAARTAGPGLWKWDHYYDIYHRHLARFRGRPVRVVEIGIYSGGSLDMWSEYFGPGLDLHGVDIEPACRAYERPGVRVHIGDQADRAFWARFRDEVGPVDVVIDDGGHGWDQQRVTLEESLPAIRPGGVYLCEDIHGWDSRFAAFVSGLAGHLHEATGVRHRADGLLAGPATGFQAAVDSVHIYPFVVVIERRSTPVGSLVCPRRGTQWEPHL